jgi:hypothetical protein
VIGKLVREPLLHFLLLGALLFAGHGWLRRGEAGGSEEIVVDAARVAALVAQFERVWQRSPDRSEIDGLVQAFVREEILYREGLALGLDRDDPVVRRRVGQKLAFLADGAGPEPPGEADLEAWLRDHAADYAIPARYSVRQVFFDPARRGAALGAAMDAARSALASGRGPAAELGDATLLPAALERVPLSELEKVFGGEFAQAVAALPPGSWQGPIQSGYGAHLVLVEAREEASAPALAAVRAEVERDWLRSRAEASSEAFYRKLRERYSVRFEPPEAKGSRVAVSSP